MTGLFILLDTDKFPSPKQNNIILDAFLSTKLEVIKSLKPLEEKIFNGCGCFIIVVLRPDKISFDYIINDLNLKADIVSVLNNNLDLSKIADTINSANSN